ncbi:MAG: hypothetical protein U0X41_03465 [Chitinophagales bacterium]
MRKTRNFMMMAGFILAIFSCKKDDLGKLGGETDLELTKVGRESSVYVETNGGEVPEMFMTVVSNDNGNVTYKVVVDFTGNPDSAAIVPLIPANLKDAQNRANFEVKLRITSEGIQDYINDASKPFTLVKYDSNVGDSYSFTTSDGVKITRTVTEKTGVDDFPFGMMYIKTTKVEQTTFNPVMGALVSKITYRANHKFGLVYMEASMKNGNTMKIYIYPWFLM